MTSTTMATWTVATFSSGNGAVRRLRECGRPAQLASQLWGRASRLVAVQYRSRLRDVINRLWLVHLASAFACVSTWLKRLIDTCDWQQGIGCQPALRNRADTLSLGIAHEYDNFCVS